MERELKYALPDVETGNQILTSRLVESAAVGAPQEIEMRAVYYDTTEGDFVRAKMSFRIRRENGRIVATAKTSGKQYGALYLRGEWETEVSSDTPDLRAFLAAVSGGEEGEMVKKAFSPFIGRTLRPLCGTEFVRQVQRLSVGGAEFELCIDRGELVRGTRRAPLCEVELELQSGDITAMEEFGAALCDAYGLRAESLSKFKRAMAL